LRLIAPRIALALHVREHGLQLGKPLFGYSGPLKRHCERRCIPCCAAALDFQGMV